jgi:hypothetical protein
MTRLNLLAPVMLAAALWSAPAGAAPPTKFVDARAAPAYTPASYCPGERACRRVCDWRYGSYQCQTYCR